MALNFNAIQRAAAFAPATAFPLDARSYFESYDLAVAAAATAAEPGTDAASNTVYYFGETLVVNEGGKATLYIIQPDGTLKEVGAVPVGDGKSIEVVNGQIKLKGFGSGYYQYNTNYVPGSTEEGKKDQYVFVESGFKAGLQPQVVAKASGEGFEIAWYEPNPTTVEGLQAQITALDGSVNNLTSKVDTKADASSLALYQTRALPSISGYASAQLSVEGALAEVMGKAMSNAGGITVIEGRVATAEGKISTVEGKVSTLEEKVSTIETTYATTSALNSAIEGVNSTISGVVSGLSVYETIENVNAKVSTINNAIASVEAKFSGYYTKDEIDGKVSAINDEISGIVEDLEDYAKISYVDAEISKVVEVARGKTQTFVVNYADNAFLNSQDAELNVQQFITIDGKTIAADTLKAGDVILVVETDVPDRWVKQVNEGDFVLAKLETTKVDLEPYARISYVDAEVSVLEKTISDLAGNVASADAALGNRISVLEAKPFDTYAAISYVDEKVAAEASARVSKDDELDAAIKAEVSRATGAEASLDAAIKAEVSRATGAEASLRTDVDHLLSQAVLSVSGTDNLHLSIEDNILTGSVLVSHLELPNQVNLVSWADAVDSTLSNHASRLSTLEAKPFDTYASISYVEGEVSKLDAAIKAEASARASADASLATRLELVEDSLGLGGEGNHGGVAEQIATIIEEVWGANASASKLAETPSRIDDHEGRIEVIEDKVTNTLATQTYVQEQIQSAEHVISVKTDDTDFFEITKDQDDIVTINVKDDIENIIAGAITEISVKDPSQFNMSISGHTLIIDHSPLLNRIGDIEDDLADTTAATSSIDSRVVALESNAVLSVSAGDNLYAEIGGNQLTLSINVDVLASELVDNYASTLASGIASQLPSNEIIKHVFGVESIASNAVALVSSVEIVSALDDLGHNHDAIKSTVQKAVTSVQTSTLVMSHSGNNLMINLPSVIWLDGGSASDTYEAEEAVYNELLNNEYGN